MRRALSSLLVLSCLACDAPSTEVDAGASDAATTDAAAPLEVLRPSWGTCPDGWNERTVEDVVVCAPPARVPCTGATFQLPGGSACEPVDDHCEGDRFPTDLLSGRTTLFVDASAAAGGDGTEALPFRTLDDALGASGPAPTSIALAAGDYAASVALPADLELHGVCAGLVRIVSSDGGAALVVRSTGRLHLAGVTLTGEGLGLASQGAVVVRGVVVDGVSGVGIGASRGTIDGARILVRGTRSDDGALGRGISLEGGASATLADVVLDGNHEAGIAAGGATLDATRIAIERTAPRPDGRFGAGVSGFEAAHITVRDSLVSGASEAGVVVEAGSELTLDAVVIEDVISELVMPSGPGVVVRNARATLSRLVIERATGTGLVTNGTSVASAADVLVLSTQRRGDFATGIASLDGAQLDLSRATVLDSAWVGVVAAAAGLRATDLVVRRVAESADVGQALLVHQQGTAEIDRFLFEETHAVAVMVVEAGSEATLRHGVVRGVRETAAFGVGRGVEVDVGGHLALVDVAIEDVVETGVVAYGGLVEGTSASLVGVRIREVHERSCATTDCPTEGGGTAVAVVFGAVLTAEGLDIEGAPLCGVQVAESASLDIASGTIRGSAIGACVQIADYDLARIVRGVVFQDNERNVETTSVYVPPRGPMP